jgi:hypothetical protein
VIVAPFLGVLLAAGVAVYLRLHGQSMPTMPLVEIVVLGLVLGPILEESFFGDVSYRFLPMASAKFSQWFLVLCCLRFFTVRPIWRTGPHLPGPE